MKQPLPTVTKRKSIEAEPKLDQNLDIHTSLDSKVIRSQPKPPEIPLPEIPKKIDPEGEIFIKRNFLIVHTLRKKLLLSKFHVFQVNNKFHTTFHKYNET